MKALITGAAGFVGRKLTSALIREHASLNVTHLILTDLTAPPIPAPDNIPTNLTISSIAADLSNPSIIPSILASDLTTIFLLHGIMSAGAEAAYELGFSANFSSTLSLLQAARRQHPGIRVVYASTLAVYGGTEGDAIVTEATLPLPQSSYGMQKMLCEYLINDFSRRGWIDGVTLRVPTVIVRPGTSVAAASAFASEVFREPLQGRRTLLPVGVDVDVWVCSVRTLMRNLVHAAMLPGQLLPAGRRQINIPGVTVSVRDILAVLEKVGGSGRRGLVAVERDAETERVVGSWPSRFDTRFAGSLGFSGDEGVEKAVRDFIEDEDIIL